MDYQVDFNPTNSVIRLTVTAEIITLEMAEGVYNCLKRVASHGGPYAAIYDLSIPKSTTLPTALIRSFARRPPSIPMGRTHVVVGNEPAIYRLARIFQMCREALGRQIEGHKFEVVHSLEEAYEIVGVGVRHEDFTQRLFPKEMAA
jgi:hypothetical protein